MITYFKEEKVQTIMKPKKPKLLVFFQNQLKALSFVARATPSVATTVTGKEGAV